MKFDRRLDGKAYSPSTMQLTVAGLQRFMREYHSVAGRLSTVNLFVLADRCFRNHVVA